MLIILTTRFLTLMKLMLKLSNSYRIKFILFKSPKFFKKI